MEKLNRVLSALKNNGFSCFSVKDKAEALSLSLSLIGDGSVGIGGSMTVEELGLYSVLKNKGNKVFWHWRGDAFEDAEKADVYVCSANAVTEDGKIMQTDGVGNRIGCLINGPKEALLIVGKNKIVKNSEQAYARIKGVACAKNARRLGAHTPCAQTGECLDCRTAARMCSITAVFERPSKRLFKTTVILVNEDLGY